MPTNYETVQTLCGQGMICHQGSELTSGVGECPSGFYCPHRNHTGIVCPPRHFCPGRGNILPQKCPKGTFNMHYGQKNCTACTLSFHCPTEGLFLPIPCPPGYVCNSQGIVTPEQICPIGYICLGGVSTGLDKNAKSCAIIETVGTDFPCNDGVVYL